MKATFALAAAVMVAAAPAAATTVAYRFDTTGNTAIDGAYGNSIVFDTANRSSTLEMSVTAWQSNLLTNTITSAYLGAYAGGLGVTGVGDAGGAGGLHQIDNAGLYTDFLLLSFNQAVTLASIKTNSYGIDGSVDNDAVWGDASAFKPASWTSTAGFDSFKTNPLGWAAVGQAPDGSWRLTGATTASTEWVVGAAFLPLADRDDGFKLASVTVAEQIAAVPEPASWGMLILGCGAMGAALRRRRATAAATVA